MSYLFAYCDSLKKINLLKFKTDKVTDMSSMFNCCYALKELNLSTFKTDKLTKMSDMFHNCSSLKLKCNDEKIKKQYGEEVGCIIV